MIVYGQIRIITDVDEKMEAMQHFFDKFFAHIPKSEYNDFTVTEINPIHVAKIRIEKWFGKRHLVPEKAQVSFYPDVKNVLSPSQQLFKMD